ncbi:hypothetical protein [Streptacidiphilus rugosus]|nr:hypothetical protein [Streptacidiphilus rugosus]
MPQNGITPQDQDFDDDYNTVEESDGGFGFGDEFLADLDDVLTDE